MGPPISYVMSKFSGGVGKPRVELFNLAVRAIRGNASVLEVRVFAAVGAWLNNRVHRARQQTKGVCMTGDIVIDSNRWRGAAYEISPLFAEASVEDGGSAVADGCSSMSKHKRYAKHPPRFPLLIPHHL